MRRVLCVHMPTLAIDRTRRDRRSASADTARPLVLTRRAGSSFIIEHVCRRGRQLGLRPAMTLGQAQAVAPDLRAHPHEPQRDRALLNRLANWALRFSPIVEPVAPDTLHIDISGCQRLFGSEINIARQTVGGLLRQGLHARAAVADTVGAAYALATVGADLIVVVPAGQTATYLAPLPPAALRIEPPTSERLDALGVRTIGDLLKLPRAALPARFGPQVVLRLQQALGEVFEVLTPHEPESPLTARISFEAPLHELPPLQTAAERLLAEVFEQLAQRSLALRRLECVLYYDRLPPGVISIGLSRAARAARHVGELLRSRLEGVDLTPGVCGVALVARETSRWRGGQSELFEPGQPGHEEELGCLLDRIANRLGADAVLRPCLVEDHQPERAFRYTVETGVRSSFRRSAATEESSRGTRPSQIPRRARNDKNGGPGAPDMARPVQLLPRPVPIRVIALLPDGPPTWMCYRGREHVLAGAWGPERIATAWWRGPDVRRDYFRVASETGEQFWIFCAQPDRQWFLHGIFA